MTTRKLLIDLAGSTNGLRKAGTGLLKLSVMPSRRHGGLGLRVGSSAMAETRDLAARTFKIPIMIRRKANHLNQPRPGRSNGWRGWSLSGSAPLASAPRKRGF
jgi:hypothetical protein